MKTCFISALLALSLSATAQQLPYQNSSLTAEERATDLLGRLTIEEKAKLMMDNSPAVERLGIPAFQWWNEALHGVGRNGIATVFPITMQMAATWNDRLVHQVFTAVSDEARAKHQEAKRQGTMKRYQGLSFWTPNINIFRDPRWGRGQETYGEDPFLTTRMGLAVVRGLQGYSYDGKAPASRYAKLLACAKHFAVHSGPEWNRHKFDVQQLPPRDLWETYLPAFKSLVQEGEVAEIMCAYQRIDGDPCCGNARFEQQILRQEWGFRGLITSDCGAVRDFLPQWHAVSPDSAAATSRAILSGTDVECGSIYESLPQAVRRGDISEAQVDRSLHRLLTARFRLGDFDDDSKVEWTSIPYSVVHSKDHQQLALKAAREGIVLLKNNGMLPLAANGIKGIAIMGPNANDSVMQWGNYNGKAAHTMTVLQAMRERLGGDLRYVKGCEMLEAGESSNADSLLKALSDISTVVFVGGISPRLEGEEMKRSGEGFYKGDRTSIELPRVQRQLLRQLHEAGKRIVLVNCSGSAMAMTDEQQTSCDAIIQAWYGGEFGGQAVADVITGEFNPCGRLPVTFYRSTADLPDFEDYRMQGRTYRYFDGEVLYPFGFGLSYTTFAINDIKIADAVDGGKALRLTVRNTGKREGTEVVQVYVRRTDDADGPLRSLRAYQRVTLDGGQQTPVTIALPRNAFELWDAATHTMRVVSGQYEIMVGTSSADHDLQKFIVSIR